MEPNLPAQVVVPLPTIYPFQLIDKDHDEKLGSQDLPVEQRTA
jgi:hypothetical protein